MDTDVPPRRSGHDVPDDRVPRDDIPGNHVPAYHVPGYHVPGYHVPGYHVTVHRGTAATLHGQRVADPAMAEIRVQEVTRPALVLGSSQDERVVDRAACERAGVDLARRRSGGGAVLLVPGEVTWLDVVLPRGALGWDDDVHRPMVWLGRRVRDVLQEHLAPRDAGGELAVHEAGFRRGAWSDVLCFDGLGAGEVTLDGRKLVGISQRRTRGAARLQCSWYSSFDWRAVLELLAPAHRPPLGDLGPVATVPTGPAAVTLAAALADRLPGDPA